MEEAIKLAIEKGGYELPAVKDINFIVFRLNEDDPQSAYRLANDSPLLDPLFWQALDKALGWSERKGTMNTVPPIAAKTLDWLHHWHRFIDWIAEGKDADEFFKQLIP